MESLALDSKGIQEYQKNRYPYLMIDMATEVIPGVSAKGYKNLTTDDWFFECHFPGDPNMPGMLQLEAIVQMSALTVLTLPRNKGKIVYVVSGNNMKWSRKVLAGERFDIDTKLLTWGRGVGKCTGVGSVNGEVACRAEFNIVMPDILSTYKVST
jgi:3-hydroxyacyl-[acyl-carrier-protein] dehydratase